MLSARHLARCLQNPGRSAHEAWLGARNSSFSLNRHRQSVEILETSDLCGESQELSGRARGRAPALSKCYNPFHTALTSTTKQERSVSKGLARFVGPVFL